MIRNKKKENEKKFKKKIHDNIKQYFYCKPLMYL